MTDREAMRRALRQARCAEKRGEVPVGAVIVHEGKVIGRGFNLRETSQNALCHAEIRAIEQACRRLGFWRLCGCTLYVTLEPCPMCAGAIMNARIDRVVYGAKDPKAGAYGSVLNLNEYPVNHRPEVTSGVLEEECAHLLSSFFRNLRSRKKQPEGAVSNE
ncbi:MAG: tRNA adenosine(34) deaminase TadA [Clostridia bacterium]|nr:tRNA adenosine(34) deaminase TadA [Clostridia bacterium]